MSNNHTPPTYISQIQDHRIVIDIGSGEFDGAAFEFVQFKNHWIKEIDGGSLEKLRDLLPSLYSLNIPFSDGPGWSPAAIVKHLGIAPPAGMAVTQISWTSRDCWEITEILS